MAVVAEGWTDRKLKNGKNSKWKHTNENN
jgi:hypothetical protein